MRVIAQVADRRLSAFPNVPTIKEAGFDIPNVPQVRGILMPPGVSADAVAYYENLFARLVKTPTWRKYLEEQQFEDGFQRSGDLAKFMDSFTSQMRDILNEAGAKVVR